MYFTKEFRRKQRRDLSYLILEYINYYNMPHHVIEFVIKSFHFQHIFLSYFSLLFLPKTAFINVFWTSLLLFLLFFYLDGCVLSNVEYKLCKNKKKFINIIDPLLYVLGKKTNTNNRYFYTLYFALVYFAGCIIKFVHIYSK
mgnify:FL=1|jgi:hypothetical protein